MRRVYLYKLTSDRGGAPCAPAPQPGEDPLLTLAICKPAIRRTAQVGDRILGISSQFLAQTEGYPLLAVIYAAVVAEGVDAREYCGGNVTFAGRPDCIYEFHQQTGRAVHAACTALHRSEAHLTRDLGSYPLYRNGRVLVCRDFRYFGSKAPIIPARLTGLVRAAETLGQGHRVFVEGDNEFAEAGILFRLLWRQPGSSTPATVDAEAYEPGHRRHVTAPSGLGVRRALPRRRC